MIFFSTKRAILRKLTINQHHNVTFLPKKGYKY
jgi:hypothetical protein